MKKFFSVIYKNPNNTNINAIGIKSIGGCFIIIKVFILIEIFHVYLDGSYINIFLNTWLQINNI